MAETRRKFDQDFKEGAFRLVRETGRPVAQVARDLGINAVTLGNWVDADRRCRGDDGALNEDEAAELARLRKENAELAIERVMCSSAAWLLVKDAMGRHYERPPLRRAMRYLSCDCLLTGGKEVGEHPACRGEALKGATGKCRRCFDRGGDQIGLVGDRLAGDECKSPACVEGEHGNAVAAAVVAGSGDEAGHSWVEERVGDTADIEADLDSDSSWRRFELQLAQVEVLPCTGTPEIVVNELHCG